MSSFAPHRLATSLEERIRSLEVDFHRAYWESQIEATAETDARRAELELELRRVKGEPEALIEVREALEEELHDPVLRRQLEVLRLSLTANQMSDPLREEIVALSTRVESEFASYRPEVNGRRLSDNEILEILTSSDDVELRKRAWEASKEVGTRVEGSVRELARLRNQAARDLGFADFYRMSLELAELSEEWLLKTLDEIERLTEEPFRAYKGALDDRLRDRFGVQELRPWHYADPFFQEVPPDARLPLDHLLGERSATDLTLKSFAAWGIDLSGVLERSDLYPRERKNQHAFCIDVDRLGDVRILANVVPGEHWMSIMLHEAGHAAYDVEIDPELPYLLRRSTHIFVTEAMAILSGRLVRSPRWLIDVAGVSESEVYEIAHELTRSNAAQDLVMARWVPVMAHFERELYSDPEGDLDSLWWELVERFQLISPPPDRSAPDWAAKIHVSVAPVYYHSYLLGAMLASQIERAIERDCGALLSKEAGRWLVERLFRPGNLLRWDALIEEATGVPLRADDLADWVRRAT
ncbi:MAG: M2 family metallopeptidase [Actinomycetota bacterium]